MKCRRAKKMTLQRRRCNIFRCGTEETSFRASYSCRSAAYNGDIKYGSRGDEAPEVTPAGGFFSPYRPVRLAKQGLPVLRGRAGLRASSSGKWLTAYIYLPLAPSGRIRRHSIHVSPLSSDP